MSAIQEEMKIVFEDRETSLRERLRLLYHGHAPGAVRFQFRQAGRQGVQGQVQGAGNALGRKLRGFPHINDQCFCAGRFDFTEGIFGKSRDGLGVLRQGKVGCCCIVCTGCI